MTADIIELRPGGLSAADMEAVEVIAMMLLRVDDARGRISVTSKTVAELVEVYGEPSSRSGAFRFPVTRWGNHGSEWIVIDQGRVRVTVSAPSSRNFYDGAASVSQR
jgi:hypothetical protein